MKKKLNKMLLCCAAVLCTFTFAQTVFAQITVTGTVSDNRETLPGVNVVVKGTTTGIVTDLDGRYSITVPNRDAVLTFTYIGYNPAEFVVGDQRMINVTLTESAQAMEEVVVMGYTTRRRSEVSGAVATVSNERLLDVQSKDLNTLLQGKIGGVVVERTSYNPNRSAGVTIRGNSSMSSAAPLVVVDGIVGGQYSVSDVKSITILKDAAATGLYGARAANGVIVVETNSGGSTGITTVTASATLSLGFWHNGPIEMMNSEELFDFQKSWLPADDFERMRPSWMRDNGTTDWAALAYQTAVGQDYLVSVNGGNDKTQFYMSGNYYMDEGIQRMSYNDILNVRSNITHRINSKLQVSLRLNARLRNYGSDPSGGYGASNALSYMPWDKPYMSSDPTRPWLNDGELKTGMEGNPFWTYEYLENFMYGMQYNKDYGRDQTLTGDFTLTWNILPNLIFSSYNRGNYRNRKRVLYYDARTYAGAGIGELRNTMNYNQGYTSSNRLTYNLNFDKHLLQLLAVQEYQENSTESNLHVGEQLSPGVYVMEGAAEIKRVAPFRGGSASSDPGSNTDNKWLKMLVQADYSFDQKYYLVASYIREGSSRFGKDNRFGNFFTVGGSWIATNEDFMKTQTIFDVLKIRLSYGLIGNAEIGNYASLDLWSLSGAYMISPSYLGQVNAVPGQLGNPDLKWERIGTTNLGFDMSFLKRRLNITLDFYDKVSHDLLYQMPVPSTSGYNQQYVNLGSLRNYGLEASINSINIQTRTFRWDTDFNITFNRNYFIELAGGSRVSGSYWWEEGEDRYQLYNRKWLGVDPDTGSPMFERIDPDTGEKSVVYNQTQATQQKLGKSAAPWFQGGITNEFGYKNFSFRFHGVFVVGNTISGSNPPDGQATSANGRRLMKGEVRWEKPGDIATAPQAKNGGNNGAHNASSRSYQRGDYFRLTNISLGYSLPKAFLNKLTIQNARLTVSGDDLLTLTKYRGANPASSLYGGESGETANTFSTGYLQSKRVSFGLNVTF